MKIIIRDLELLNEMILKKGYSQRGFGRKVEISSPYAYQLLNGKRNPGPKIAKDIADALEVEFDDIFFIESGNKSAQKNKTA